MHRKIGKIGRWKLAAKQKINRMLFDHEINTCEIGRNRKTTELHPDFKNCKGQIFATPAHRHKQIWYNTRDHELYSYYKQVLWLCAHCHQIIEQDRELTEKVFMILRGEERE